MDVFWVEENPPVALAIVLCPRANGQLADEMRQIRESGVDTLVSLLEPGEAAWLGLEDEEPLAERAGLRFFQYPIRDAGVPRDRASFRTFVANLAERLRAGERIGLHCRGCIGRAPITAACTLVHLGWTPAAAITAIAQARGCTVPDTLEQYRWIMGYKAGS
jgi:protein-tyrosine phosphatase